MASSKKRNKLKSLERRDLHASQPAKPHPDGDRRRREFGQMARDVLKEKIERRQAWLDAPTDD